MADTTTPGATGTAADAQTAATEVSSASQEPKKLDRRQFPGVSG